MDLETYLHLVLSRNSAETIDLTVLPSTSRTDSPLLIDLTQSTDSPAPSDEAHIDILMHLAEREAAFHPHKKGLSRDKLNRLGCWRVRRSKETLSQLVISSEQVLPASCAICLEDFKEAIYVRSLRCGHVFHKKCIDIWLCHNASCPLDRRVLGEEDK